METQNGIITHTASGTGFELEARQYTYAGAPAFEIYGVVGRQPTIGPVAYYEDGPRGVEYFVIEDALTAFVRAVYDQMFAGHYDITGNPDPALMGPIEAEIHCLIEDDLIHSCMADIPPARLYKPAQIEVGPWYFYLTQKGAVVIEYLPTGRAAHDAYFVDCDATGVITNVIEGARSWVQTDPFWGLQYVQSEQQTALKRLQASLQAAIEGAVREFNRAQTVTSHA